MMASPAPPDSAAPPDPASGSSPPPPARVLSPAAAAALRAAEARAQPPPRVSTPAESHTAALDLSEAFNPSRADLLPFYKLLDSELLPKVSKPQAVSTLSTLHTLLSNILHPPNPSQSAKFRQLRTSNKLIQREVIEPAGGAPKHYLVLCGFRREVREFEEYYSWSGGQGGKQLFKLRCGKKVLETRIGQAKEADEREKRYRESEKEAEAARKQKALLGFEEDRLDRAEKDAREKHVRDARAGQPPPPVQPRSTGPSRWRGRGRGGAATGGAGLLQAQVGGHTEDEEDEEDEEDDEDFDPEAGDEDAPPSYGELHGRVLGTGLPPGGEAAPAGVNMVNEQDLE
ncbi:PUB domain-containing protein [Rhodotorula paludigena]|uniref:PUB domain-containing protein n=1 Tax=Rhodotorula paludigena TaxID=86838 RepID=UPI00317CC8B4